MIPSSVRMHARLRQLEPAAAKKSWLESELSAMALPVDVEAVAARIPVAVVLSTTVLLLLFGPIGAAAVAVAAGVVVLGVRRRAPRRRAAATERALPGVLDAVARNLRSGGSLAQAIAAVTPPTAAPDLHASWPHLVDLIPMIGVSAALDQWTVGSPPETGLNPDPVERRFTGTRRQHSGGAPGDRRPIAGGSVHLAAAALSLAATTGGSPARAIDGVAATLRSRLAVADEIRALSSQARASAAVIALAPIVFGVLAGVSDARTRDFLGAPAGLVLLAAGLALDAIGAWWMAHLCRPASP